MTPNQQLVWDTLRADPARLCHSWAQDILKNKRSMHRKADKYLGQALQLFSIEDIARMVKTWLNHYAMPLNPTKLANFNEFHDRCGHYVMSSCSYPNKDAIKNFV